MVLLNDFISAIKTRGLEGILLTKDSPALLIKIFLKNSLHPYLYTEGLDSEVKVISPWQKP